MASTFLAEGDYTVVDFLNEPFNMNNRRQCFNVSIVNDNIPENAESFNVTIMNSVSTPLVIVEPADVIITILDRDCE